MEVRTQQVIYGVAEAIAVHNLLKYVQHNTSEERIRMATGAGMAALGYVFGPELEARIRNLNDEGVAEKTRKQIVYAAGGAVLGSLVGYKFGPQAPNTAVDLERITTETRAAVQDREHPGGLVTIASVGWLGYSLFFDGKTKEEQQRHLWGLGAGVIGYMYGPEMLRRIGLMQIPRSSAQDAVKLYTNGSAIVGGIAGGLLGWYKGADIMERIAPSHQLRA
jgi:membrane protein YqaA with SNARE-associated domain